MKRWAAAITPGWVLGAVVFLFQAGKERPDPTITFGALALLGVASGVAAALGRNGRKNGNGDGHA